jgi:hypothetical protein
VIFCGGQYDGYYANTSIKNAIYNELLANVNRMKKVAIDRM